MVMRGDALLRLRLLSRPRGLLAVVGALAGAGAVTAAYLPWYAVAAKVALLGSAQSRPVATLAGWEAHPWGWVVPALALAALGVGVAGALDRPLPREPWLLGGAGAGLGLAAAAGGVVQPPLARFDLEGSRLRELADLAERLPKDVELTFSVRPAVGMWVTLGMALVLVTIAVLERDQV